MTDKEAFIRAVQQHLSAVGASNWKVVFDRFPDLPDATKWRWVRIAKKVEVPRPELINARAKIVQKTKKLPHDARKKEAQSNGTSSVAHNIPAAPSPDYIARTGESGLQNLDFVAEIHSLYADATMLREFSIASSVDASGAKIEKIKNPVMFDKSIVRRATLLENAIRAVQEVWDLRTMQHFYETIIDEIGTESPEVQQRIIQRLAELNAKMGMTMGMKV